MYIIDNDKWGIYHRKLRYLFNCKNFLCTKYRAMQRIKKSYGMNDFLRKDKLWKWTQVQSLKRSIPVTKTFKGIEELHSRKPACPERF